MQGLIWKFLSVYFILHCTWLFVPHSEIVKLFQNEASLLLIVTSSADSTVLDESLSLPTPVVSGISISPATTVYVFLWCVDKNSCSLHSCEDELGVRRRSLVQSKHERPFKPFLCPFKLFIVCNSSFENDKCIHLFICSSSHVSPLTWWGGSHHVI